MRPPDSGAPEADASPDPPDGAAVIDGTPARPANRRTAAGTSDSAGAAPAKVPMALATLEPGANNLPDLPDSSAQT